MPFQDQQFALQQAASQIAEQQNNLMIQSATQRWIAQLQAQTSNQHDLMQLQQARENIEAQMQMQAAQLAAQESQFQATFGISAMQAMAQLGMQQAQFGEGQAQFAATHALDVARYNLDQRALGAQMAANPSDWLKFVNWQRSAPGPEGGPQFPNDRSGGDLTYHPAPAPDFAQQRSQLQNFISQQQARLGMQQGLGQRPTSGLGNTGLPSWAGPMGKEPLPMGEQPWKMGEPSTGNPFSTATPLGFTKGDADKVFGAQSGAQVSPTYPHRVGERLPDGSVIIEINQSTGNVLVQRPDGTTGLVSLSSLPPGTSSGNEPPRTGPEGNFPARPTPAEEPPRTGPEGNFPQQPSVPNPPVFQPPPPAAFPSGVGQTAGGGRPPAAAIPAPGQVQAPPPFSAVEQNQQQSVAAAQAAEPEQTPEAQPDQSPLVSGRAPGPWGFGPQLHAAGLTGPQMTPATPAQPAAAAGPSVPPPPGSKAVSADGMTVLTDVGGNQVLYTFNPGTKVWEPDVNAPTRAITPGINAAPGVGGTETFNDPWSQRGYTRQPGQDTFYTPQPQNAPPPGQATGLADWMARAIASGDPNLRAQAIGLSAQGIYSGDPMAGIKSSFGEPPTTAGATPTPGGAGTHPFASTVTPPGHVGPVIPMTTRDTAANPDMYPASAQRHPYASQTTPAGHEGPVIQNPGAGQAQRGTPTGAQPARPRMFWGRPVTPQGHPDLTTPEGQLAYANMQLDQQMGGAAPWDEGMVPGAAGGMGAGPQPCEHCGRSTCYGACGGARYMAMGQAPGAASGSLPGTLQPGQKMVVGENGPEIFEPDVPGRIIPLNNAAGGPPPMYNIQAANGAARQWLNPDQMRVPQNYRVVGAGPGDSFPHINQETGLPDPMYPGQNIMQDPSGMGAEFWDYNNFRGSTSTAGIESYRLSQSVQQPSGPSIDDYMRQFGMKSGWNAYPWLNNVIGGAAGGNEFGLDSTGSLDTGTGSGSGMPAPTPGPTPAAVDPKAAIAPTPAAVPNLPPPAPVSDSQGGATSNTPTPVQTPSSGSSGGESMTDILGRLYGPMPATGGNGTAPPSGTPPTTIPPIGLPDGGHWTGAAQQQGSFYGYTNEQIGAMPWVHAIQRGMLARPAANTTSTTGNVYPSWQGYAGPTSLSDMPFSTWGPGMPYVPAPNQIPLQSWLNFTPDEQSMAEAYYRALGVRPETLAAYNSRTMPGTIASGRTGWGVR